MPYNIKKTGGIILALILLSVSPVSAPSLKLITIAASVPAEPYKRLIHAIGMVETKGDTLSFNPVENAVGYFQIRPIKLKDYNAQTRSRYKMNDLFSYEVSEKIFLYFAEQIGPNDLEQIAKKWNGSGRMTINYWNRVKRLI